MSTDTMQKYIVQCEDGSTLYVMARDEPEAMHIAQGQTDAHVSSARRTTR